MTTRHDPVADLLALVPGMIRLTELHLSAKQRLQVERRVGQQLRADLAAQRDQLVDQAAKQADLEQVVRVAVEQAVAAVTKAITTTVPSQPAVCPTEAASGLISRAKAAKRLGVSLTTLDGLDIPKSRLGRRVLYRVESIDEHVARQVVARQPSARQRTAKRAARPTAKPTQTVRQLIHQAIRHTP